MPFPRQRGEGFLHMTVKIDRSLPEIQHIFMYVEVKPFAKREDFRAEEAAGG